MSYDNGMAGNNGKKVLDLINNAIGKTKNRPQIASAFDESKQTTVKDPKTMADIFN